jgi:hypothetical protein
MARRPKPSRSHVSPTTPSHRVRPQVESLEERIVPYTFTGNAWPSPQLVTISFVPDGTIIGVTGSGYAYSNLFQKFNARFGTPATWEKVILQAAQTWAAQTNLNFTVVGDNGTAIGQGAYQQGDPNMGDIRVGGFAFGNNWLGQSYYPPPGNNYSIAGDLQLNTSYSWHIGSTYDLFTVAAHEFGHALGLGESTVTRAVEYAAYNGIKNALTSDDIAGIQSLYGVGRSADIYNIDGLTDNTLATAASLTSLINPRSQSALVPNLDLVTPSSTEYYAFLAPLNTTANLSVTVQSVGLSLLTPQVTLLAADGQTVLGSATGAGQLNGSTLTVTTGGVTPLELFYVKVTGADSSVFSTGTYDLIVNFGSGSSPTVVAPNTQLLNGTSQQGTGAQAQLPPTDLFGAGPAPLVPTSAPAASAEVHAAAGANGGAPSGTPGPAAVRAERPEGLQGTHAVRLRGTAEQSPATDGVTTGVLNESGADPLGRQGVAAPSDASSGAELWAQLTAAHFAADDNADATPAVAGTAAAEQGEPTAEALDPMQLAAGAALVLGGTALAGTADEVRRRSAESCRDGPATAD